MTGRLAKSRTDAIEMVSWPICPPQNHQAGSGGAGRIRPLQGLIDRQHVVDRGREIGFGRHAVVDRDGATL